MLSASNGAPDLLSVTCKPVLGDGHCMYTATCMGLGGVSLDSLRTHRDAGMRSIKTADDLMQMGFAQEATEWAMLAEWEMDEAAARSAEAAFVSNTVVRYTAHPNWSAMRYGGWKEMLALSKQCNGALSFLVAVDSDHGLSTVRAPPVSAAPPRDPAPRVEVCMLHCNIRGARMTKAGALSRARSEQNVHLNHWEVFEFTLRDGTVLPAPRSLACSGRPDTP
jgi:hypothetical protein